MRLVECGVLALLLGGCEGTPAPNRQAEQPLALVAVDAALPDAGVAAQRVFPAVQRLSRSERERISLILALLDNADQALLAKRLAQPAGESAMDYYRQVLQLHPGHEEARLGLEKIIDRYLEWSDAALRRGRLDQARLYLSLARSVDPGSSKIELAAKRLSHQGKADAAYTLLDSDQLKAKSPVLIELLGRLADRIRAEDARVTIEAPSDAQGRWIYQQLNLRHDDFRIRANLRLKAQPGIRLLD